MAARRKPSTLPFAIASALSCFALLLCLSSGRSFLAPPRCSPDSHVMLRSAPVSTEAVTAGGSDEPVTLDADLDALVDVKALDVHTGSASSSYVSFRQNFAGSGENAEIDISHNFQQAPEDLLNLQVQMELTASHAYQAMAAYFDRADVALPGFQEWAEKQSAEEREHAEKIIEYINLRGGNFEPLPIMSPDVVSWSSALDAMKTALRMEMQVNKALLNLHASANEAVDPQLCDFLESEFLTEQVQSINHIAKVIRKLVRVGPGLGEHRVDTDLA